MCAAHAARYVCTVYYANIIRQREPYKIKITTLFIRRALCERAERQLRALQPFANVRRFLRPPLLPAICLPGFVVPSVRSSCFISSWYLQHLCMNFTCIAFIRRIMCSFFGLDGRLCRSILAGSLSVRRPLFFRKLHVCASARAHTHTIVYLLHVIHWIECNVGEQYALKEKKIDCAICSVSPFLFVLLFCFAACFFPGSMN